MKQKKMMSAILALVLMAIMMPLAMSQKVAADNPADSVPQGKVVAVGVTYDVYVYEQGTNRYLDHQYRSMGYPHSYAQAAYAYFNSRPNSLREYSMVSYEPCAGAYGLGVKIYLGRGLYDYYPGFPFMGPNENIPSFTEASPLPLSPTYYNWDYSWGWNDPIYSYSYPFVTGYVYDYGYNYYPSYSYASPYIYTPDSYPYALYDSAYYPTSQPILRVSAADGNLYQVTQYGNGWGGTVTSWKLIDRALN